MDEPVPVTTVDDEMEADVVCGLLRSAGLECGFRATTADDSAFEGLGAGRMEILVHPSDLAAAREILGAAEESSETEPE
jgi:Putative prokaryotic signal transducing protein